MQCSSHILFLENWGDFLKRKFLRKLGAHTRNHLSHLLWQYIRNWVSYISTKKTSLRRKTKTLKDIVSGWNLMAQFSTKSLAVFCRLVHGCSEICELQAEIFFSDWFKYIGKGRKCFQNFKAILSKQCLK